MERMTRQLRAVNTDFLTRDDGETHKIQGYFAVFNSVYEIAPGMTESIAPGAFSDTLDGDIRALTNHDTTLVLGRTQAGTLELREDDHGLWGSITINPNDVDAMNTWHRVARGDVTQCSIGFNIIDEATESRADGVHWTIKKIQLLEVSVCTFPAYEETNVSARSKQLDEMKKRKLDAWKTEMKGRLQHGN